MRAVGLQSLIVAMWLLSGLVGLAADRPAREVWIALRSDGTPGTGTVTDPFDGSSVEKLNALFADKFIKEYGDNLTIHLGPGVFYGDRTWRPCSNWKIRGAGMDVTILRTKPNPDAVATVGFRGGSCYWGPGLSGVEVSDMTFDFNVPAMRKANRVFVARRGTRFAEYYHVTTPPPWSADTAYEKRKPVVVHKGQEYMLLDPCTGQEPGQTKFWTPLRQSDPRTMRAWRAGTRYVLSDTVAVDGKGYICVLEQTRADPRKETDAWHPVDPNHHDPLIYTQAVFVSGRPPRGQHRVSRVKAVNCNGSWFFDKEDFVIGLGGDDCVIEDCHVSQFHGDYSTLMVLYFGHNSAIRGCTALGNAGRVTMAYGGWGCHETVFESNNAADMRSACNIDSLGNRNVTFRGNTFVRCRKTGILVNLGGGQYTNKLKDLRMPDAGPLRDMSHRTMDGLFIYNNLVTLSAGAPFGAIQVQQNGLRNVSIHGNVLRSADGRGDGLRAIGVLGNMPTVVLRNNLCDRGMYCEIKPADAVYSGNVDFSGAPMFDRYHKRPLDRMPARQPVTPAKDREPG